MTAVRDRSDPTAVLVVDFGAQYAQLIARRVREAHVYSEIVPHTITAAELADARPGRRSSSAAARSRSTWRARPASTPTVYDAGVPILGICYGAQLVARDLGGERGPHRPRRVRPHRRSTVVATAGVLFGGGLPDAPAGVDEPLRHDHRRRPTASSVTASTADVAGAPPFEDAERRIYGVQFHPEVVHTPHGQAVLEQFLYDVCGCRADVDDGARSSRRRSTPIRAQVGTRPGDLRAVRRRRLRRRRRARAQGHRARSSPACSSTPG